MSVDYALLCDALRQRSAPCGAAPAGFERNAVCLLLVDRPEPNLLAIQKTDTEGYDWRDHVALPGGRIESTDRDGQDAALREVNEELGIPRSAVEVLGDMGHFQTSNTKNDLEVWVGRWARPDLLSVDDREIQRVLEIRLVDLVESHVEPGYRSRQASAIGEELAYPLSDARIWGVTARILHEFLEMMLDHGILTSRTG